MTTMLFWWTFIEINLLLSTAASDIIFTLAELHTQDQRQQRIHYAAFKNQPYKGISVGRMLCEILNSDESWCFPSTVYSQRRQQYPSFRHSLWVQHALYYGKVILHWILFSFMRLLIMYVKQVRVVKQVKFSLIKKCLHNSELHFLPISRADLICLTLPIDFKSLSAKKEMDGMLLCLI